jgi:hypothetical protein
MPVVCPLLDLTLSSFQGSCAFFFSLTFCKQSSFQHTVSVNTLADSVLGAARPPAPAEHGEREEIYR